MKTTLLILVGIFFQNYVLAQGYFKKDYPAVWQRASDYTMETAEAMPAAMYGFRPKEENMTFHGQLVHLIQNLAYLSELAAGTRPDFFQGRKPDLLTKQEISSALQDAFRHVRKLINTTAEKTLAERIDFAGESITKETVFYLMRDHMTHHRAQAILYLRANGIEAPKYRGW